MGGTATVAINFSNNWLELREVCKHMKGMERLQVLILSMEVLK